MNTIIRLAVLVAAAALTGASTAATPISASTMVISPSVVGTTEVTGDSLTALILWRGTPGWFSRNAPGPGHPREAYLMSTRVFTVTLHYGTVSFATSIDWGNNTIKIADTQTVLGAPANVFLIDDVDAPKGPRLVKTLTINPGKVNVDPRFANTADLYRSSDEIMAFLRCDVVTGDPTIDMISATPVCGKR
jgi:hypothetical protein